MFNSISYFSPFPFQNVPTLFLEGKGDGSQLLFDFTYFKVYISILSPRFWHLIAFGCFHFPDGWGGWGTGWKGRCTCRPGFKAEGGTPQHPHKVSRIWMNFLKQTQTLIAGSTSVLRAFNCMEFPLCSWWTISRGAGWWRTRELENTLYMERSALTLPLWGNIEFVFSTDYQNKEERKRKKCSSCRSWNWVLS